MKKIFSIFIFSMLVATASFATDSSCYKMRLGNYKTVDYQNFNYLCIGRTPKAIVVIIYNEKGPVLFNEQNQPYPNLPLYLFYECTETKLASYEARILDGSVISFLTTDAPDSIICKDGLFIVYEKPVNDRKATATKLVMGGLRYSISYSGSKPLIADE
ncbi:MAG: hypothetical protein NTY22_03015 [Proteobacteria bacterium]|nr:hypothetical protein [Pseudomonadota bacterium]